MDAAANHIWQSTLVGGLAAALTLLLRTNRASARYWIWFAASMKFLVPFAVLSAVAGAIPWPILPPAGSEAVRAANVLFRSSPAAPLSQSALSVLFAIWLAGVVAVLAKWIREWARVAAIARAAEPVSSGPVFDALRCVVAALGLRRPVRLVRSDRSLEPGVAGFWRPVLIWPHHLSGGLDRTQIDAIVAHEAAHVHRGDNVLGAAQMLVTALFWFHPMVWWIGARMVDERERACDEQVLALGHDSSSYAAGILETCKRCLASTLVNVPGVTGGDLKKRIRRIMEDKRGLPLNGARKAALAVVALALLLVPALDRGGIAPALVRAQDGDSSTVYRPGPDVTTPRLRKEVKPRYSERAKAEKVQGEVQMECVVKADGTVGDIRIVRPLDPELDQAAVDAARQWEFDPGTRNGKPVNVLVTIMMAFTLKP